MPERRQQAPAQNDLVRQLNRQIVLQAVAGAEGPSSRTLIARATGLSVPTVNTIVNEFVAKRVLREVGAGPSGGGRPAQRVRLVPDSRLVLAFDLSGPRLHGAVVDLEGATNRTVVGPVLRPGIEEELLAFIGSTLRALPDPGSVGRLAFAVPGVVDPRSGEVRLAPTLGWDDHPLAAAVEDRFGVPVTLENDVNALALAELHYGLARGRRYVVCVSVGDGIGAGMLVDGRLYRGASAAAGEIGYSLLTWGDDEEVSLPRHAPGQGLTLRFGAPGPFERRLREISRTFLDEQGRIDLSEPEGRAAFEAFSEAFGFVMHNLVCMVNPEMLVIRWPADTEGALAARVAAGWRGPSTLTVRASALGPDAALKGVARLALDEVERELCGSAERTMEPKLEPKMEPPLEPPVTPTVTSTMEPVAELATGTAVGLPKKRSRRRGNTAQPELEPGESPS